MSIPIQTVSNEDLRLTAALPLVVKARIQICWESISGRQ
jgi:hypothetical protein